MKGNYHYTGCGLDNIYLANGFERKVTPYGEGVSIADADGLHEAIGRLPERQRLTLTLRIQDELKFREIAEALECPIGTAKANFTIRIGFK